MPDPSESERERMVDAMSGHVTDPELYDILSRQIRQGHVIYNESTKQFVLTKTGQDALMK